MPITRLLLFWSLLLVAANADAQPTGWSSQSYLAFGGFRYAVQVLDLGVGGVIASFNAPPGVTLGPGALTPDGRYYLVATSLGLARFTTSPPAFDRLLGPATAVAGVFVAPIGTDVHVTGSFGRAVLDWQTGDVRMVTCCARPWLVFTPDGTRVLEGEVFGQWPATETIVTLRNVASGVALWSRTLQGMGGATVSNANVALSVGQQVLVLDTPTGEQQGSIPHALGSMHWRGNALVGIRSLDSGGALSLARISSYTLPALAETVLTERPFLPGRVQPVGLHLSADGRYAYWLQFVSLLGISVSNTSYSVFDLDERRFVGSGGFGYQSQSSLALEATPQCVFSVPDNLTVSARGAVVDVPVVPTSNCRPWSAPGAMNPGPHSGAVVIREQVEANANSQQENIIRAIGGTALQITQAADRPAAPILRGAVEGNRIHLRWDPSPGAGITAFEVRGATLGGTESVETVASTRRDWLSPPLGPGSYVVRIAAGNSLGLGPASNEVRFSIGVETTPAPPEDLRAAVVDDQVTLTWAPPATGPAPAGYVIEAAPVTTGDFVAVTRSADSSLRVRRTPPGPWEVRVRAATDGGVGGPSAPVVIAPSACTSPPGVPGELWPLLTYPVFTLRWSAPATGSVDQYQIELGSVTGASDLGRVNIDGGETSVTVPQVSTGGTRAFARLRARNACGESAPSVEVVVQLP